MDSRRCENLVKEYAPCLCVFLVCAVCVCLWSTGVSLVCRCVFMCVISFV